MSLNLRKVFLIYGSFPTNVNSVYEVSLGRNRNIMT